MYILEPRHILLITPYNHQNQKISIFIDNISLFNPQTPFEFLWLFQWSPGSCPRSSIAYGDFHVSSVPFNRDQFLSLVFLTLTFLKCRMSLSLDSSDVMLPHGLYVLGRNTTEWCCVLSGPHQESHDTYLFHNKLC